MLLRVVGQALAFFLAVGMLWRAMVAISRAAARTESLRLRSLIAVGMLRLDASDAALIALGTVAYSLIAQDASRWPVGALAAAAVTLALDVWFRVGIVHRFSFAAAHEPAALRRQLEPWGRPLPSWRAVEPRYRVGWLFMAAALIVASVAAAYLIEIDRGHYAIAVGAVALSLVIVAVPQLRSGIAISGQTNNSRTSGST